LKTSLRIVAKIIFGIFLFAGLPIIGWGIFDLSGYFSNPARSLYTVAVVVMQIAVVLVEPELGRQGNIGKVTVRRQRLAIPLLQILSLGIIILAPFCDRRDIATFPSSNIVRYLGLVVCQILCKSWEPGSLAGIEIFLSFRLRITA
jgi:hypothetical protein